MSTSVKYDSFPLPIVVVRASLLLLTLAVGTVIFFGFGWAGVAAYLALAAVIVGANLTLVCRNCAYRGSVCDSGMSCLATVLMGRIEGEDSLTTAGSPSPKACEGSPSPKACEGRLSTAGLTEKFVTGARRVVPWFMLLLAAPLLVGVVQLVLGFAPGRWPWVVAYLVLVALVMVTTARLACPHCRMADICPLVGGGTTLADIKEELQPVEEEELL